MTLVVFIVALILAGLHWYSSPDGWLLFGNVTIYVAAFVATLAAASAAAMRSKDRRCIAAAVVLIINFVGSHFAWTTSDPVLFGALNDLVTAAYFMLIGQTRWELAIGALSIACVAAGGLTVLGIIPGPAQRADAFIAFSYPDVVALLGHAANIVLGLGAGDAGLLARNRLRVRPMALDYRRGLYSRIGWLAKVAPDKEGR